MRRVFAFLALTFFFFQPARACDFCNCLLGINPFYIGKTNLSVTFMYQNSEVTSAAPGGIATIAMGRAGLAEPSRVVHGSVLATEFRRTAELAAQVFVTNEIVLTALIPFTSVTSFSASGRTTVSGNGDLMLYGQYVLRGPEGSGFTALAGGGIQLPTGRTDAKAPSGTPLDYRFQPGTGSAGFVLTGSAFYSIDSWILAVDLFGKLNQMNGSQNRLGHPLSAGVVASHELYRHNPSLFALVGSVGLRSESTGKDIIGGVSDIQSGSTAHYLNAGVQVVYDSFRADLRSLIPLVQERPSGGANEHTRFLAGLRLIL